MAESIKIRLDGSKYIFPTSDDIASAKDFVLRRNETARNLEAKIDDCLAELAQHIVTICYRYDVVPEEFEISSRYNEQMMSEIADAMDDAESEITNLIYEYSTQSTTDRDRSKVLLLWIASLGRNNNNLQTTLDNYLFKMMKDVEAAVAALRKSEVALAAAITKVKSNLHTIYTMPEVQAAFKTASSFNAAYIRTRGVVKGNVGLSNNGSTNVTNMAKITLEMAWNRSQVMDFQEQGAVGYYQLRGSLYPCEACDDEVGFHLGLEEIFESPLVHPHCCCYRVPVFAKETNK